MSSERTVGVFMPRSTAFSFDNYPHNLLKVVDVCLALLRRHPLPPEPPNAVKQLVFVHGLNNHAKEVLQFMPQQPN